VYWTGSGRVRFLRGPFDARWMAVPSWFLVAAIAHSYPQPAFRAPFADRRSGSFAGFLRSAALPREAAGFSASIERRNASIRLTTFVAAAAAAAPVPEIAVSADRAVLTQMFARRSLVTLSDLTTHIDESAPSRRRGQI